METNRGATTLVAPPDACVAAGEADRAERVSRAREALVRAERLTGARSVRTAAGDPVAGGVRPGSAPYPGAGSALRPGTGPSADDEPVRSALITAERPSMAVPRELAPLLPDGLRRGGTTAVEGSTSLVLALLSHACDGGAWAALVGMGDLGVLAAAQAGMDLGRMALVPTPGPDAPTVIAALLDGVDVVVVGPAAQLTDADRRRLSARSRDRGSVLLPTSAWAGADVTLTVEGGRWAGIGEGDGWLRAHRLRVARRGRGVGAVPVVDLVLPLGAALPGWSAGEPALDPTADLTGAAADGRAVDVAAAAAGLRLVG